MKIMMLRAAKVRRTSTISTGYPKDWIGQRDAAMEAQLVEGKDYVAVEEPKQLTQAEIDALKDAAQQLIEQQKAAQTAATLPDAQQPDETSEDLALADLTIAELKEIATGAGLAVPSRITKAELIALIEQSRPKA